MVVVALILIGASALFVWVLLCAPRLLAGSSAVWAARDDAYDAVRHGDLPSGNQAVMALVSHADEATALLDGSRLTFSRLVVGRLSMRGTSSAELTGMVAAEEQFWSLDEREEIDGLVGSELELYNELHARLVVGVVSSTLKRSWGGLVAYSVLAIQTLFSGTHSGRPFAWRLANTLEERHPGLVYGMATALVMPRLAPVGV